MRTYDSLSSYDKRALKRCLWPPRGVLHKAPSVNGREQLLGLSVGAGAAGRGRGRGQQRTCIGWREGRARGEHRRPLCGGADNEAHVVPRGGVTSCNARTELFSR